MKKLILIFAAALTIVSSGCKKGFLDVNTNPNQSTNANPELVLPAALANTAARLDNAIGTFSFIAGWMGYVAPSGSYALSSSDFSTYKLTSDFGAGIFQGVYDNLADYNYVEKSSHDQQKPFLEGIAKIIKAVNYQLLVDLYNNVPYNEALQGTAVLHPVYDDAQAIYGDLFKQITAGMALIKTAPETSYPDSKTDIMFAADGGDAAYIKDEWLKFANSVKLRMLLRMSEMTTKPAYFETEKSQVAADQTSIGFLDIDATVNPGYANSVGKQNPFFASNINVSGTYINDFWRANAFAIKFFQNTTDPRLGEVYKPITSGAFVGNTVGSGNNAVGSASSVFGPGVLRGFDQDASIMLAAESYFEQAEAALRGWITGDPQSLYEQAVTESFRYDDVPDFETAAQDYYTQGTKQTDYSANITFDEKLTLIIKQKWAAEDMINVVESYNDYRRFVNTSHSPKPLADIPLSVSNSVDMLAIPYRLLYPTSETKTNTANIPQLPGALPGHTNKIFWMP